MTESPSISGWKKLAVRAFFGGAGFACALALIAGIALWYHDRPERPKPWNTTALKATYDTLEYRVGSSADTSSYPVAFYLVQMPLKWRRDQTIALSTTSPGGSRATRKL